MTPPQLRRPPSFQVAGAAAAALFALSGCASAPPHGVAATGAGMAAVTVFLTPDRPAMPAVAGKDLDGGTLSLGDLAGQVVVVNVWGSWCGPCRGEADDLQKVAVQSAAQGVRFLGIDTRDQSPQQPRAFVRDHAIGYPSLFDPSGTLLLSFPPGILNPQAIPSTLVIDRHGRVAVRALQPVTAEQLHTVLDPVVEEHA